MQEVSAGPKVIKDAKGKRPEFFEDKAVDHAMSMILVLASELNVVLDRVDSIERASKANGFDLAAAIENLELDQEALEAREARRQNFLERLYYLARKDAAELAAEDSKSRYKNVLKDIAKS